MCLMSEEERFEHCFQQIILHEGGLSKDKRDPGGTTNWGISLRYLRSIGFDVDGDGKVDENDIIGLPIKGAKGIYRKYWWKKYRYSEFSQLVVVEKVFDMAVNMGGFWAHKLLQIAINRLNEKPIQVDGILGSQTRAAANNQDGELLREELRKCAEHRYIEIIANNPAMEWAKNGWIRRAKW